MKSCRLFLIALFFIMPILISAQETRSIEDVDIFDADNRKEIVVPSLVEMDYITTGELSLPFIDPQKFDLSNCKRIFSFDKDKVGIVRTLKKIDRYFGYETGTYDWHDDDTNTTFTKYRFMFLTEERERMIRAFIRIEADGYYPVNSKIIFSEDWYGKKNNIPKMESCVSIGAVYILMKKKSPPIESFGKGFSTQVGETFSLKYITDDPNVKETGWTFDTGGKGFQSPYDAVHFFIYGKEVLFVYPFDKKFKNPMSVTVQALGSPHGFVVANGVHLNPETWTHQVLPIELQGDKYVFNINGGGIYYVIPGGPVPKKSK